MKKLLALVFSLSMISAFADEVTYTGLGTSFSDPNSWSATPQIGDTAVIPEGVTAEATATDKTFLQQFNSCRIETDATLFLNAITFTWDDNAPTDPAKSDALAVNLTGPGRFYAEGGKTYLSGDNREFTGVFVSTQNVLAACTPYSFGTTNHIYIYSASDQLLNHELKLQRVNGPSIVSNHLHFATPSGRRLVLHNIKNPLTLRGSLDMGADDGSYAMFRRGGDTAYAINFECDISGSGFITGSENSTYAIGYYVNGGNIDMAGGFSAWQGGFTINAPIRRAVLDAARKEYGFVFTGAGYSSTNCTWFFDRSGSYTSGGYFDLNGYNQKVGDICTKPNDNPFPGCVIKSDAKALVTCCGGAGRTWGGADCTFSGVLIGKVSFCYDYDGRGGANCLGKTNSAGKFIFTGTGSTTEGGLSCRRGELRVASTAEMPNLTELKAFNTGLLAVETAKIGDVGGALCVQSLDEATIDIAEGVTLAADTACARGNWLEKGTYGSAEAVAAAGTGTAVPGFTGLGLMTVERYGGKPGMIMIVK